MAVTYTEKLVAAMKKGFRREWCNSGFKRQSRAEDWDGKGSYFHIFQVLQTAYTEVQSAHRVFRTVAEVFATI